MCDCCSVILNPVVDELPNSRVRLDSRWRANRRVVPFRCSTKLTVDVITALAYKKAQVQESVSHNLFSKHSLEDRNLPHIDVRLRGRVRSNSNGPLKVIIVVAPTTT